jgi:adenylyltransferase/sulfurtransferase
MALSAAERARYQRHLTLDEVGVAGQEKLKRARVLVIGAGGLGSPSALYLAASGIGTLGVLDCDRVDVSNLQRQVLFDSASVERPKAVAARERLLALNPGIEVVAHEVELRAANVRGIVERYDVVLDGTDRLATRYLVNDACVILGKPLVSAAIHRFEGQVMTYVPGRGPCYRCLYAEVPEGLVPNCADAGVLGVLPGVLGAIQATEAIKLVVGAGEPLVGRLLVYDALEMQFREFAFARRADCAVCGDRPTITEPADPPQACDAATMAQVRRIPPSELRALLAVDGVAAGTRGALVVDVREPREFAAGRLPGSVNIPLAELRGRLGEIPRERMIVFVCRSGARSLTACGIAAGAGVGDTCNLEGGLLAWAGEIDPALVVASAR